MSQLESLCTNCVLDASVPEIVLNERGVCNYCELHAAMDASFPQGVEGNNILEAHITEARRVGKGKKYDCIVGVSGGTDSMYLLHHLKSQGLRPLAVNLDNGFHTEIAVSNIKKVIEKLGVDLETYVIDYDEMKDILLSHMRAGLPWIDSPTDIAIVSSLYRIANAEGVKHVFVGNNFRTEGRQPTEWTHSDGRQLAYVQNTFGTKKLRTFPNLTIFDLFYFSAVKRIKMIKPLYYMDYNKSEAMKLLEQEYGWRYYGGHHHESVFTRFAIAYWLLGKFGIDKRKVTLSALVRSKQVERSTALQELRQSPYDEKRMSEDKDYVVKKLGITEAEFQKIWHAPNKNFQDYPSYYPLFNTFPKLFNWFLRLVYPTRPMMTFELAKGK